MARTGGNPVKSPTDELYVVGGRILGGSGVATIKAGNGFSLTYVSTGVYKITPDLNYPYVTGGGWGLMSSSHTYLIDVTSYTGLNNAGSGGTAGSVTFTVTSSGTPTDLGSSDELWFTLTFARTVKP